LNGHCVGDVDTRNVREDRPAFTERRVDGAIGKVPRDGEVFAAGGAVDVAGGDDAAVELKRERGSSPI
jgi:hypothetical protein